MESDKNPTFIFKEINETSKTLHVFLVRSLHYPSLPPPFRERPCFKLLPSSSLVEKSEKTRGEAWASLQHGD